MSGRLDRFVRDLTGKAARLDAASPRLVTEGRATLEADLLAFVRAAWPILEPGRPFVENWHHGLIAEYLTAVAQRQVLRLILNVPPRHTKSRLVTTLWPCWCWAREPGSAWIFGSYAAALATRHSLDRRAVLSSDWFRARWGDRVALTLDQNQKDTYENTARGTMLAVGVGGGMFGMGADVVVIDDPHTPSEAVSEAERETGLRWFDHQVTTRLNDPATGAIVVIMQRLHQRDLTGHLLEQGGWTHVCLPAEAEGAERIVFPVSGTVHERAPGALLWPERFGEAVLAERKRRLGSWGYAGQFQQRPTPLGGGIFQREWFRYYDEPPPTFDDLVQSWDCAFKDTTGADYVVGQVWGMRGADCYLLDQVRGRWDFPRTLQMIRVLARKWPEAVTKLVEDKANGPAVIATLRREVPGLVAVNPEGGKQSRAQAVSPLVEAGNVHLPRPERVPWVGEFVEECGAFPTGAHDDQVDAMTQALGRLMVGAGAAAWVEFTRQEAAASGVAAAMLPEGPPAPPERIWSGMPPTARGPVPLPALCPRCNARTVEAPVFGTWRCRACGASSDDEPEATA